MEEGMKVVTRDIDYTKKLRTDDALHYIRQTLNDAAAMSVSIKWGFDEQQADAFHCSWKADKFIEAVEHIISTISAGT